MMLYQPLFVGVSLINISLFEVHISVHDCSDLVFSSFAGCFGVAD